MFMGRGVFSWKGEKEGDGGCWVKFGKGTGLGVGERERSRSRCVGEVAQGSGGLETKLFFHG